MTETFADAVFEAQDQMTRLGEVLLGALTEFYARGSADDKCFDSYDYSVEFWAKPGTELTEEEQAVLWTLGFQRCWIVYREDEDSSRRTGEEKYYKAPGAPAS